MTLTRHAEQRLRERGISEREIQLALARGTPELSRGAVRVRWHDVVVVCSPEDWGLEILTAYRNPR
jgi:hypothetical protein